MDPIKHFPPKNTSSSTAPDYLERQLLEYLRTAPSLMKVQNERLQKLIDEAGSRRGTGDFNIDWLKGKVSDALEPLRESTAIAQRAQANPGVSKSPEVMKLETYTNQQALEVLTDLTNILGNFTREQQQVTEQAKPQVYQKTSADDPKLKSRRDDIITQFDPAILGSGIKFDFNNTSFLKNLEQVSKETPEGKSIDFAPLMTDFLTIVNRAVQQLISQGLLPDANPSEFLKRTKGDIDKLPESSEKEFIQNADANTALNQFFATTIKELQGTIESIPGKVAESVANEVGSAMAELPAFATKAMPSLPQIKPITDEIPAFARIRDDHYFPQAKSMPSDAVTEHIQIVDDALATLAESLGSAANRIASMTDYFPGLREPDAEPKPLGNRGRMYETKTVEPEPKAQEEVTPGLLSPDENRSPYQVKEDPRDLTIDDAILPKFRHDDMIDDKPQVETDGTDFMNSIMDAFQGGGGGGGGGGGPPELPEFGGFSEGLSSLTGSLSTVTNAFSTVYDVTKSVVGTFNSLTSQAASFVKELAPATVMQLNMAYRDLNAAIGVGLQPVVQSSTAIIRMFGATILPISEKLRPVFETVGNSFVTVADGFAKNLGMIGDAFQPVFDALGVLVTALEPFGTAMAQIGQLATAVFAPVIDLIGGAIRGVAGMLGGVGDLLKILESPMQALIAIVNGASAVFRSMFESIGTTLSGFFGPTYKNIFDSLKSSMESFSKYILLAAANIAKFLGVTSFIDGMIKGLQGGEERKDTTGLAAAQNATIGGIADFNRAVMQSALLAGGQEGKEKGTNDYLKELLSELKLVKDEQGGLAKWLGNTFVDAIMSLPGKIAGAAGDNAVSAAEWAYNQTYGRVFGQTRKTEYGVGKMP